MKEKTKENPNILLESEAHLRSKLCELESCQYLMQHITSVLRPDWGTSDDEFNEAISLIHNKISLSKLSVWGNIGMLATINPSLQVLIKARLKDMVDDSSVSISQFLAESWQHSYTGEEILRAHIKNTLNTSLNMRDENVEIVHVPARKITDEL